MTEWRLARSEGEPVEGRWDRHAGIDGKRTGPPDQSNPLILDIPSAYLRHTFRAPQPNRDALILRGKCIISP